MLLGVLYMLAVSDIHCENVIATGEHPVIVDLETMLTPTVSFGGSAWSALSTGVLPRWQTAPDGHRFDLSGLGADGTQDAGILRRAWKQVNTDQMHLSDPIAASALTNHLPRLGASVINAAKYCGDLIAGFEEMYGCLLRSRENLAADASFFEMFDNLELRTLLRSTATYTRLQLRLLHPEFMRSGIDRTIELEWLARPMSGPIMHKLDRERIYEQERDAMERLDVPSFTTTFAERLSDIGGDPDLAFLRARRDGSLVRERLAALSMEDCRRQTEIIHECLRDRYFPSNGSFHSDLLGRERDGDPPIN
jgi:lantibiotic modifying enzyme